MRRVKEPRLKPIEVDRDTYRMLLRIYPKGNIPYYPTIREEGGDKKDGKNSEMVK